VHDSGRGERDQSWAKPAKMVDKNLRNQDMSRPENALTRCFGSSLGDKLSAWFKFNFSFIPF